MDEASLGSSIVVALTRIKAALPSSFAIDAKFDPTMGTIMLLKWLNIIYNDRWLIIFDIVNDPTTPGLPTDSTTYRNISHPRHMATS